MGALMEFAIILGVTLAAELLHALLPLPVMAIAVVVVVFVLYQFVTSDLQAFIYFQF